MRAMRASLGVEWRAACKAAPPQPMVELRAAWTAPWTAARMAALRAVGWALSRAAQMAAWRAARMAAWRAARMAAWRAAKRAAISGKALMAQAQPEAALEEVSKAEADQAAQLAATTGEG